MDRYTCKHDPFKANLGLWFFSYKNQRFRFSLKRIIADLLRPLENFTFPISIVLTRKTWKRNLQSPVFPSLSSSSSSKVRIDKSPPPIGSVRSHFPLLQSNPRRPHCRIWFSFSWIPVNRMLCSDCRNHFLIFFSVEFVQVWSIELDSITPCWGNSRVLAHWLHFLFTWTVVLCNSWVVDDNLHNLLFLQSNS